MVETEYSVDIGFIISKAPAESNLVANTLEIARGAVKQGKSIELFLISDGVWLIKKNQKNPAAKIFNEIRKNIKVTASKDHLEGAGIEEKEIVDGVSLTKNTYKSMVELVMENWKKVVSI